MKWTEETVRGFVKRGIGIEHRKRAVSKETALFWWKRAGSNRGPPACEAGTLTSWATPPSGWSCNGKTYEYPSDTAGFGGDDETRTHDFHTASVTLYQLSYAPIIAIAEFIIPYFLSGCNPFLHFFKIVMRKKHSFRSILVLYLVFQNHRNSPFCLWRKIAY